MVGHVSWVSIKNILFHVKIKQQVSFYIRGNGVQISNAVFELFWKLVNGALFTVKNKETMTALRYLH